MEIKVHDIIKFSNVDKLEHFTAVPEWVLNTAAASNYGVVRRMPISNKLIPIGLRGESREQRFGTYIHEENIVEVITPNSLVMCIDEFKKRIYYPTLKGLRDEFSKLNLSWGPTGSIGFEMATNINVTSMKSDIDISLYIESIDEELLKEVGRFIKTLDKQIDVQVEIPIIGAFLLNDYIRNYETGFIIRTPFGPQLCSIQDRKIKVLAVN
ncbi:malonate decarboxylase holo-ACP synthase [Lysinibacillus telephonicus]|uniref:Malonate decarboxylase holo-ACP synthase n=1 Tax=Lysinibacillus telephonicus TaxID=1714840 RepID=A0A3S0JRA3_9BACI|nr:malonate decarboxylase holo-ACP synthase [Lysinibacillus telephonicus]RTQ92495.1 malonate decarboxylase holo-ACP synthase [Lysinibacillus telephonicus]